MAGPDGSEVEDTPVPKGDGDWQSGDVVLSRTEGMWTGAVGGNDDGNVFMISPLLCGSFVSDRLSSLSS
jgi:hypothetical protein